MHVLCILDKLPIPGQGDRKVGKFPLAIKAHVQAGFNVAVVVQSQTLENDCVDLQETCDQLGAKFVSFGKYLTLWRYFRYCVMNPQKVWRELFCRNGSLLAGLDNYIEHYGRPNVIVALTRYEDAGLLSLPISKMYGIPYLIWECRSHYQRGLMQGERGRTWRKVLESAKLVLTVSPQLGESIQEALQMKMPHIVTMPNPVPEHFFIKPNGCDWVQQFAKNRFIFAGWANWQRELKRLDIALESFALVHSRKPQSCLIIAGPVPAWSHEEIKKKGLADAVLLTGPLNREEILCLAHECNCCILTSDHETFGIPLIEAMAAGKPAIATKCGGPESIITDQSLGRLVNRGDWRDFAAMMCDTMTNYSNFDPAHISQECRRRYSEEQFAAQWLSVYRQLKVI